MGSPFSRDHFLQYREPLTSAQVPRLFRIESLLTSFLYIENAQPDSVWNNL
jgi:hypothetical protein